MTTAIVTEEEFRRDPAPHLAAARAGQDVVLVGDGVVPLRLAPAKDLPRRQFGTLKGVFRIADDFDETPVEILESIEAPLDPQP